MKKSLKCLNLWIFIIIILNKLGVNNDDGKVITKLKEQEEEYFRTKYRENIVVTLKWKRI